VKAIEVTFRYRRRSRLVASAHDFQGCRTAVSASYPPKFIDVGRLTRSPFSVTFNRLTTSGRRSPRFERGSLLAPWFVRIAFAFAMVAFAFAVPACDQPPLFAPSSKVDAGTLPQPTVDASPAVDATVGGADAGTDAGSLPRDYSIVVLPDTQYYAASFPDIFMKQASWIVENRDAQQIAFVLHTGDLVDTDVPAQWTVASNSLHMLDGVVPYVIAAGNHDYGDLADRMGMVNSYFPASGFANYSWFGDTFESGHIENSFSVIPAGGMRWLVLSLEFGPRDEAIAWANSVLQGFHDLPAIIITHAYLYHDSSLYNARGPIQQNFNPHGYVMMGQAHTTINDGQEMWQKLILPNANVKMVFSGHDVNFVNGDLPLGTTGQLSSKRPDGSVVHQILANYQTCTAAPCDLSPQGTKVNGGYGYLRIVRFSQATSTISVSTYSPVLDMSLTDATNQFVLPMN
jgi:hypothetical protein